MDCSTSPPAAAATAEASTLEDSSTITWSEPAQAATYVEAISRHATISFFMIRSPNGSFVLSTHRPQVLKTLSRNFTNPRFSFADTLKDEQIRLLFKDLRRIQRWRPAARGHCRSLAKHTQQESVF